MVNKYVDYADSRGNPTNLAILSFTAPDDANLASIRLYLKSAGPTYTLLDQSTLHGLGGYVEYWYPFLTAVHGESYAVDFLRTDGSATAKVDCEAYFPGAPDTVKVWSNMAQVHVELLHRHFLVLRQFGERAILLRQKVRGQRCDCWDRLSREASRECPSCYGIGFLGGYDVFPKVLFRLHPQGQKVVQTEVGFFLDAQNRGYTMIVPQVTGGDTIVRMMPGGLPRAYEISNVTRSSLEGPSGIPTIQEFSLVLIEQHMAVYKAIEELAPSAKLPPETRLPVGIREQ